MSFECHDLLCRESIRLPRNEGRTVGKTAQRLMPNSWVVSPLEGSSNYGNLLQRVADHTKRQPTYPSDTINAMLGILHMYAKHERIPVQNVCSVSLVNIGLSRILDQKMLERKTLWITYYLAVPSFSTRKKTYFSNVVMTHEIEWMGRSRLAGLFFRGRRLRFSSVNIIRLR